MTSERPALSRPIEEMKRVSRKRGRPRTRPLPVPKPPKSREKPHPTAAHCTEDGKFKTGNGVSPGRPRGSRNKLGEQFLIDLQDVWAKKGKGIIEKVAREKPHELLKVISSLLPRQLHVQMNQLAEYSDEQLAQIRMLLEARTGAGGEAGRNDMKLIEAQPVEVESPAPAKGL